MMRSKRNQSANEFQNPSDQRAGEAVKKNGYE